uniref:Uncharacterized protein n=1 Tax=Romanomermis culicivorax TaxID=13658 RepID=A0A915HR71_ROMCU
MTWWLNYDTVETNSDGTTVDLSCIAARATAAVTNQTTPLKIGVKWSVSPYERRLMNTYNYDLLPQSRSNAPVSPYPYQYSRYNVSSSAPTLLPDVGYNSLTQQYPPSGSYQQQQQQQYQDAEIRRRNGSSYGGRPLSSGPLNLGRHDYAGPTDGPAPLLCSSPLTTKMLLNIKCRVPNRKIIGQTSTPRCTWQEGRPIITSDPMRIPGAAPNIGGPIDLQSQQPLSYNVHNVGSYSRNNLPSSANARFQMNQPNRGAIKRILLSRDPKDKYSKGKGARSAV